MPDFGDLTETRGVGGAGSSRTRGVFRGGDITILNKYQMLLILLQLKQQEMQQTMVI